MMNVRFGRVCLMNSQACIAYTYSDQDMNGDLSTDYYWINDQNERDFSISYMHKEIRFFIEGKNGAKIDMGYYRDIKLNKLLD